MARSILPPCWRGNGARGRRRCEAPRSWWGRCERSPSRSRSWWWPSDPSRDWLHMSCAIRYCIVPYHPRRFRQDGCRHGPTRLDPKPPSAGRLGPGPQQRARSLLRHRSPAGSQPGCAVHGLGIMLPADARACPPAVGMKPPAVPRKPMPWTRLPSASLRRCSHHPAQEAADCSWCSRPSEP